MALPFFFAKRGFRGLKGLKGFKGLKDPKDPKDPIDPKDPKDFKDTINISASFPAGKEAHFQEYYINRRYSLL